MIRTRCRISHLSVALLGAPVGQLEAGVDGHHSERHVLVGDVSEAGRPDHLGKLLLEGTHRDRVTTLFVRQGQDATLRARAGSVAVICREGDKPLIASRTALAAGQTTNS